MAGSVISAEAQFFAAQDKVSRHCSAPAWPPGAAKSLCKPFLPSLLPSLTQLGCVGWLFSAVMLFQALLPTLLLCAGAAITVLGKAPRKEEDA